MFFSRNSETSSSADAGGRERISSQAEGNRVWGLDHPDKTENIVSMSEALDLLAANGQEGARAIRQGLGRIVHRQDICPGVAFTGVPAWPFQAHKRYLEHLGGLGRITAHLAAKGWVASTMTVIPSCRMKQADLWCRQNRRRVSGRQDQADREPLRQKRRSGDFPEMFPPAFRPIAGLRLFRRAAGYDLP